MNNALPVLHSSDNADITQGEEAATVDAGAQRAAEAL